MKRMTGHCFAVAATVLCLFLGGCGRAERGIRVDPSKVLPDAEAMGSTSAPSLKIALGGVLTPRVGFAYYRQLLDYVGDRLGLDVECIEKKSYAEINALLASEDVDAAFVCSKPYVEGSKEFGLELLVAPCVRGETVYHSYILVPADSDTKDVSGLRDRTFAFTDPMSNTGRLAPLHMLKQMGETPESFFDEAMYSYAHDKSIELVAQKIVDGAAVDSLVWEYANERDAVDTSRTRIIRKLGPFGIPPVVVRPGLESKLKKDLQKVFLDAHLDTDGARILGGMMIERFVVVDDHNYDSIREMEEAMAQKANRGGG